MDIEFTSKITVEMLNQSGNDLDICRSAWVSNLAERKADDATYTRVKGLINTLMSKKHGSPFESGFFEFWIDAPRGVRDENVRHRAGWSYSSSSLRYNQGTPRLYVPPKERPLKEVDDFRKMSPVFRTLDDEEYAVYTDFLKKSYEEGYKWYQELHTAGFTSTEATRWITHDGKMTPYIARCNPRSLMHFLSLRTHDPDANHVSYPMWEIEVVARKMEEEFKRALPLTYAAYVEHGREGP